ncbi:MAG: hypothetical protein K2M95_01235, partial [Clostridiales bacterium]|nr:hypothetical protein [Clostridiales bacterium]
VVAALLFCRPTVRPAALPALSPPNTIPSRLPPDACPARGGNLEGFVYVSMNAVTQACLTVVGQNYGAAKTKNIDLAVVQCVLLSAGVGLAVGGIVIAAGKPLLRFYGCDAAGIEYGVRRMQTICLWYFLCGIMEVFAGAMQGMGRSLLPMLVTMFGACVFRVIWVYTIFRVRPTFFVLMLSYPVSWILTLSVHAVCLFFLRRKVYPRLANAISDTLPMTETETTSEQEEPILENEKTDAQEEIAPVPEKEGEDHANAQ